MWGFSPRLGSWVMFAQTIYPLILLIVLRGRIFGNRGIRPFRRNNTSVELDSSMSRRETMTAANLKLPSSGQAHLPESFDRLEDIMNHPLYTMHL